METLRDALRDVHETHGGYYSRAALQVVVELDPNRLVLMRCNACRLLCPASNVKHIADALEAAGDWVRDVSMPVGDAAYKGDYRPITPGADRRLLVAAAPPEADKHRAACQPFPEHCFTRVDYGDGPSDADPGL